MMITKALMSAVKNIASVATKMIMPNTLSARGAWRRRRTAGATLLSVMVVAFMGGVLFDQFMDRLVFPAQALGFHDIRCGVGKE